MHVHGDLGGVGSLGGSPDLDPPFLTHRPSSSSLASSSEYSTSSSYATAGSGTLTPSSPYDSYQRLPQPIVGGGGVVDPSLLGQGGATYHKSFSEPQIRMDLASPVGELPYDLQSQSSSSSPLPHDQLVRYYMNTHHVKMRTRKPGEPSPQQQQHHHHTHTHHHYPGEGQGQGQGQGQVRQKPVPPVRAPESSPIWKRKGGGGVGGMSTVMGGVGMMVMGMGQGSASSLSLSSTSSSPSLLNGGMKGGGGGEVGKRMSNVSETSEADSADGQCSSSSPSSENMSTENLSLGSMGDVSSSMGGGGTLGYQRRQRMSMAPEQHVHGGMGGIGSSNSLRRPTDKHRKRLYRIGLNLFNKKPEKGLDFLLEQGFVERSPRSVAHFFISRKGLSKQMIGEFLGNLLNPFNMDVLHCFTQEIDLSGLQVDVALRKFQGYFRMPGEAQKIERLMEAFADRYCQCNPDQVKNFKTSDTVFLLAFAIIMLNTDLHNSSVKAERKMKLEDFVKNLRGIDDGDDVDPDLLAGIYERIKQQEFRAGVDQVTQVMKVEQTIVGKKPQLVLSHRRLVCYCRLYEVHDPNKKEKIGLHQREVFLFNDLLLVTKIFSKKKTGITYNFKTSLSLCGMQVYLFETPHYQYGIQLTNNLDRKPLISFNARNDHDRQKFVEDLKESILETNGMEQLRIEEEMQRHGASHNTLDKHYANDDSRVHISRHEKR
ncbi:uncharacterized protein LOC143299911 isoform X2 [Babylonia areolata]|uniref:uncharacterized protein LOC143299911 isoform X2 n=1 Tax=Babylonia areolata TaxID=304850 RepID=UPI003FD1DF1B